MSTHNIHQDKLDLKELFSTMVSYKYMILSLVFFFGFLSTYYAYFKTNDK